MMKILGTICVSAALLAACAPVSDDPKQTRDIVESDHMAARIDGINVSLEAVDAPIQLALYDLEWQRYQLRRASLKKMIEARGGTAEILLEPPVPPRLSIDSGDRPVRGDVDAPVRLSLFCSYQSSHCARLQPILTGLREEYGSLLSVAYFDFPQDHHRYGFDGALAARCGFEQGEPWGFVDSLFGIYDDLSFERMELLARQSNIRPIPFNACYNEKRYSDDIRSDISLGRSLGFRGVPIVLINGLYVKGPRTSEVYGYYIDQELDRLNIEIPEKTEAPEASAAEPMATHNEIQEYKPRGLGYDRVRNAQNTPPRDKSEITLSKAWLTDQFRNEEDLKAYFYAGDHKVEGLSVLKLADISENTFFETLGLKTGDVIMHVNGEWVHEGQNGLWTELRYSENVEIKLMRRGKPVTYYYKVSD